MGRTGQFNAGDLSAAPLFPLPNVVLFPRSVLPLHVFEERYLDMIADALEGDRQIAMALLKPGWEKSYYARPAIEPVVCVGKILSHERLPDGNCNLLLQGRLRARIVREHGERAYRTAELQALTERPAPEIELAMERAQLAELFCRKELEPLPGIVQLRQLLASDLETAEVADLLAFNLIEDVALKQSLLAETNVKARIGCAIATLQKLCPILRAMARRHVPEPSVN